MAPLWPQYSTRLQRVREFLPFISRGGDATEIRLECRLQQCCSLAGDTYLKSTFSPSVALALDKASVQQEGFKKSLAGFLQGASLAHEAIPPWEGAMCRRSFGGAGGVLAATGWVP